jgi:hypothetical protein
MKPTHEIPKPIISVVTRRLGCLFKDRSSSDSKKDFHVPGSHFQTIKKS